MGFLKSRLGPSLVSPLRVAPDFLTSFYATPLDGMILLSFLGQESRDPQSLVRQRGDDGVKRKRQWQRRGERGICVLEHCHRRATAWVGWGRGAADTVEKGNNNEKAEFSSMRETKLAPDQGYDCEDGEEV